MRQVNFYSSTQNDYTCYMIITQTKRLVIRYLRATDVQAMYRVLGDEDVMKFSDGVKTNDEVKQWINDQIKDYTVNNGRGAYAVVRKSDAEVMGYCGLFFFPDIAGQPETEIGYRLIKTQWGNGYATEAACAIRDYAFNTLKLSRLIAMVDPDNAASIRVAEKIGMRYEKNIMMDGYDHPDHVYAMQISKSLL